jgi:nitronate monooxygenase
MWWQDKKGSELISLLKKELVLPLIAAPMFLVSDPDLVMACCEQGIIGSFPTLNQRTSEGLDDWLSEIEARILKFDEPNPGPKIAPYAVNLIVNKTNARLDDDVLIVTKHKVPIIITSLGISEDLIKKIHAYGGIVLHDVTNILHAEKAISAGVDGIIAVCAGAGGHAGTISPFVLIKEIRRIYDGLLILAGGITDGHDIAYSRMMGADLAYMGTRFLCTQESSASAAYKQMIVNSKSTDIVYTSSVSGVPGNFIKASLDNAHQENSNFATPERLGNMATESKKWKTTFSAGQGVSGIQDIPSVKELVLRMKNEFFQTFEVIG